MLSLLRIFEKLALFVKDRDYLSYFWMVLHFHDIFFINVFGFLVETIANRSFKSELGNGFFFIALFLYTITYFWREGKREIKKWKFETRV